MLKQSFLYILIITFLSGCNLDNKCTFLKSPNELEKRRTLSVLPETDPTITVEDYWEEAGSIKSEALEIVTGAEKVKCVEAKKLAEKAVSYSEIANATQDFLKAERFIEAASEALIKAEDAITYCENYSELEALNIPKQ